MRFVVSYRSFNPPAEKRPPNFRNTVGVSDQIRSFREQAYGEGRPRWGVGKIFFEVDKEDENRPTNSMPSLKLSAATAHTSNLVRSVNPKRVLVSQRARCSPSTPNG